MAGVAEVVNFPVSECRKGSYHKVVRFVRRGWDKVMEKEAMRQEGTAFTSFGSSPPYVAKNYAKVSCFVASRIERPKMADVHVVTPKNPKNYRHIDCFVASGITKGEGHAGGGLATDMLNIGFNPLNRFNEARSKRQHRSSFEPVNKKCTPSNAWNKKLHPSERKTSGWTMIVVRWILYCGLLPPQFSRDPQD